MPVAKDRFGKSTACGGKPPQDLCFGVDYAVASALEKGQDIFLPVGIQIIAQFFAILRNSDETFSSGLIMHCPDNIADLIFFFLDNPFGLIAVQINTRDLHLRQGANGSKFQVCNPMQAVFGKKRIHDIVKRQQHGRFLGSSPFRFTFTVQDNAQMPFRQGGKTVVGNILLPGILGRMRGGKIIVAYQQI
jgi:hypothetical protein